jgi:hypothetical protein
MCLSHVSYVAKCLTIVYVRKGGFTTKRGKIIEKRAKKA